MPDHDMQHDGSYPSMAERLAHAEHIVLACGIHIVPALTAKLQTIQAYNDLSPSKRIRNPSIYLSIYPRTEALEIWLGRPLNMGQALGYGFPLMTELFKIWTLGLCHPSCRSKSTPLGPQACAVSGKGLYPV